MKVAIKWRREEKRGEEEKEEKKKDLGLRVFAENPFIWDIFL